MSSSYMGIPSRSVKLKLKQRKTCAYNNDNSDTFYFIL